ncbi:hypothetical protein [Streptomyces sp. NPDC005012]|uniref:hypothetical protein n=1 Tax=unclassified Streptomyces TaxID=2593676 RepID=UPI00339E4BFF
MTAEVRWPRPAAGLEPAATALLSWLTDPAAPRLCVVTGGPDSGKSLLLAWLAANGTRPEAPPDRAVHAFVPLQGLGTHATVWTLAEQLHTAARTPAQLTAAVTADGRRTVVVLPSLHEAQDPAEVAALVLALAESDGVRVVAEARSGTPLLDAVREVPAAVMDLDDPRWRDAVRNARWREHEASALPPRRSSRPTAPFRSDDPEAVCAVDPYEVTAVYEADPDPRGGLRTAWLRAGRALLREQSPAERALVLLCALGDDADPRHAPALERLAEGASWRPLWRRVTGDALPPWPGPALALTAGSGPLVGHAVVGDHEGVLRVISLTDGSPTGRFARRIASQPASVVSLRDGTVWALDVNGVLHAQRWEPTRRRATGLAALLEADATHPTDAAAARLERHLTSVPATTLAAVGALAGVGHEDGTVGLSLLEPDKDEVAPEQVVLHTGPVTALALLPLGDDRPAGCPPALLYSGGADGQVRAWAPGAEVLATPVARRPCPVTALTVILTPSGPAPVIAWGDGRIDLLHPSSDGDRSLHLGAEVNAMASTPDGALLVGTDQALLCLVPR